MKGVLESVKRGLGRRRGGGGGWGGGRSSKMKRRLGRLMVDNFFVCRVDSLGIMSDLYNSFFVNTGLVTGEDRHLITFTWQKEHGRTGRQKIRVEGDRERGWERRRIID